MQQQYHEKGFKKYFKLIACIFLVEQNNELLLKNQEFRPTGASSFLKRMRLNLKILVVVADIDVNMVEEAEDVVVAVDADVIDLCLMTITVANNKISLRSGIITMIR